jgi:hypothetical protein
MDNPPRTCSFIVGLTETAPATLDPRHLLPVHGGSPVCHLCRWQGVRRPVEYALVHQSPSRVALPVALPRHRLSSFRDQAHGAGVPTLRGSTQGGAEGTRTSAPYTPGRLKEARRGSPGSSPQVRRQREQRRTSRNGREHGCLAFPRPGDLRPLIGADRAARRGTLLPHRDRSAASRGRRLALGRHHAPRDRCQAPATPPGAQLLWIPADLPNRVLIPADCQD